MKAVVLNAPNEFSVQEMPIPVPRSGEVLVRVEATPINPSDVVFLKGLYGTAKAMPVIAGFEGSGTVISSGGGLLAWRLVGKRVAISSFKGNGTWAEFAAIPATACVVLPNDVSFNSGSCFFVNPFTLMMFAEMIKKGKHQAVIQTAACSALGKMLVRYCLEEMIPLINIVRRQEQVEALRAIGAEYVLNSSDENFQEELKKVSVNLNATIAFDCVAGDVTGMVVNAMPENSIVYIYGALSMKAVEGINPSALIFSGKSIEGLWASKWVKTKSLLSLWGIANKIGSMLNTTLKTEVAKEFRLEGIVEALKFYKSNMSSGKVILKPSLKD